MGFPGSYDAHPTRINLQDTCSGSRDAHPMRVKLQDTCSGSVQLTEPGTSLLQAVPSARSKILAVAEDPSSDSFQSHKLAPLTSVNQLQEVKNKSMEVATANWEVKEVKDERLTTYRKDQKKKELPDARGLDINLLQPVRRFCDALLQVSMVKDLFPSSFVAIAVNDKQVPDLQIQSSSDRWTMICCVVLFFGILCLIAATIHAEVWEGRY